MVAPGVRRSRLYLSVTRRRAGVVVQAVGPFGENGTTRTPARNRGAEPTYGSGGCYGVLECARDFWSDQAGDVPAEYRREYWARASGEIVPGSSVSQVGA